MTADLVFKIWIRVSVAAAAAFLVWTYVPILVPLGIIVAILAAFTWGVRRLAVRYQKPLPDDDA